MQIDYMVTLDYGTDDGEQVPSKDDVATWIMQGMERQGFTSADVTVKLKEWRQ